MRPARRRPRTASSGIRPACRAACAGSRRGPTAGSADRRAEAEQPAAAGDHGDAQDAVVAVHQRVPLGPGVAGRVDLDHEVRVVLPAQHPAPPGPVRRDRVDDRPDRRVLLGDAGDVQLPVHVVRVRDRARPRHTGHGQRHGDDDAEGHGEPPRGVSVCAFLGHGAFPSGFLVTVAARSAQPRSGRGGRASGIPLVLGKLARARHEQSVQSAPMRRAGWRSAQASTGCSRRRGRAAAARSRSAASPGSARRRCSTTPPRGPARCGSCMRAGCRARPRCRSRPSSTC